MSLVLEKKMTVAEFLEIDFEEGYFYELINGIIVKRASPNAEHQRISRHLSRMMDNFIFNNKLGEFFTAPLDVYLTDNDLTQPDLIFVSKEKAHIVKGFIKGVPDLLVEILSPSTAKTDKGDKRKLYQRCGVTEYWIIDPKSQSIEVYVLEGGSYELSSFAQEAGSVESNVLDGFSVAVESIFE
jgi:Uma2 family endonuclease